MSIKVVLSANGTTPPMTIATVLVSVSSAPKRNVEMRIQAGMIKYIANCARCRPIPSGTASTSSATVL